MLLSLQGDGNAQVLNDRTGNNNVTKVSYNSCIVLYSHAPTFIAKLVGNNLVEDIIAVEVIGNGSVFLIYMTKKMRV